MMNSLSQKTFRLLLAIIMIGLSLSSCKNELPIIEPYLENPHMNYTYYYKGQIHVHTNEGKDGDFSPTWIETEYREKGYTFISITDHNQVTDAPPPVGCDNDGHCILHIPGEENGWGYPNHILVIGIDLDRLRCDPETNNKCDPNLVCDRSKDNNCNGVPDWQTNTRVQEGIDYLNSMQEISLLAIHGLSFPFEQTWTLSDLKKYKGYTGMEILNGTNWDGLSKWDEVLSLGRDRRTWGCAGDDFETDGQQDYSFNRGWIVVNSSLGPAQDYIGTSKEDELRQDILANIKEGNFYTVARSPDKTGDTPVGMGTDDIGPKLEISVVGALITVKTEKESQEIRFITGPGQSPPTQASTPPHTATNVTSAYYEVPETTLYVRIEVDQYRDGTLYTAYSQPLYFLNQGYEGTVTDNQTGAGIPYVKLKFTSTNGRIIVYGKTDKNGYYRSRLPRGTYVVSATHSEYYEYSSEPGYWEVGANYENGNIRMSKIASSTPTPQNP